MWRSPHLPSSIHLNALNCSPCRINRQRLNSPAAPCSSTAKKDATWMPMSGPQELRCSGAVRPLVQMKPHLIHFHMESFRGSRRLKLTAVEKALGPQVVMRFFSTTTMFLRFIRVHSPSLRSVWLRCTPSAVSPPRSPVSAGSWWISGSIRLPSPHLSGHRALFKLVVSAAVRPGPRS